MKAWRDCDCIIGEGDGGMEGGLSGRYAECNCGGKDPFEWPAGVFRGRRKGRFEWMLWLGLKELVGDGLVSIRVFRGCVAEVND